MSQGETTLFPPVPGTMTAAQVLRQLQHVGRPVNPLTHKKVHVYAFRGAGGIVERRVEDTEAAKAAARGKGGFYARTEIVPKGGA